MSGAEEGGSGFLERWSERKMSTRDCVDADGPAAQSGADAKSACEPGAEEEEAPVLTDADMPSLESLDEGSDYSGFLSPGVSEDLRRKALSKLFHGARFNVADGLDDYAEDFCSFEPLGDTVTADMRHRMQEVAKRLLAGEDDAVGSGEVVEEQETADEGAVAPESPGGTARTDGEAT